jgi:hypothetical protein
MAAKKKSTTQLVEQAAELLQLKVRLKYSDDNGYVSCVTCGVTRHYKDRMQGGHYIPRKSLGTKLLEENVHPQCNQCNGFKRGNMTAYAAFMALTYGGEFLQELERLKRESKKYYVNEVRDIIQELKGEIKQQQQRVCGTY